MNSVPDSDITPLGQDLALELEVIRHDLNLTLEAAYPNNFFVQPVFEPEMLAPSIEKEKVPDVILQAIKRKVNAQKAWQKLSPEPGCMAAVDRLCHVDGSIASSLAHSRVVLLDQGLQEAGYGAIWRGWMVARETAYAEKGDVVLDERDEPCDPMCRVVQAWNPCEVWLPANARILGRLGDERMVLIRQLGQLVATGDGLDMTTVKNPEYRAIYRAAASEMSVLAGMNGPARRLELFNAQSVPDPELKMNYDQ